MRFALWPYNRNSTQPLTIRHYPLLDRRRAIFSLWLSYLFFQDRKSRGSTHIIFKDHKRRARINRRVAAKKWRITLKVFRTIHSGAGEEADG
jgi:hypothetical protein